MVRLVFRPYAQIWRSICTSESLRASTRVSPGFTLFKHSSPSFGSQHERSHSDLSPEGLWPADCARRSNLLSFNTHGGLSPLILAFMLDSLVRVSRRGNENHFVSIGLNPPHNFWEGTHQSWPSSATAPLLQVTGEEWQDYALVSIASFSAISGTF